MNCPYCGQKLLEPGSKVCTNCGKLLPFPDQGAASYVDSFEAANQTRKGLSDLRNAFLLYIVGGILPLIPVVGIIGGLVSFVGLILLIIGWRALGRSSLRGNTSYKSTGSWLIYAIIILIVVGIIGIFVLGFSAFGLFTSNSALFRTNSSSINSTAILQYPGFHKIITQILEETFALGILLAGIWFSVWIKMLLSLRKLGAELSQQKIIMGANLYIIQVVISISSGFIVAFFVFQLLQSNLISPSIAPNFGQGFPNLAPYSYLTQGGYWPLLFLISIGGTLVQVIGAYFVYSGLGTATRTIPAATPPPPPPFPGTPPSSPSAQNSFCPQCGRPLNDPANNFCPYCGTKLKS